jgi:Zn-dependent protease/CBS domain-containing protein
LRRRWSLAEVQQNAAPEKQTGKGERKTLGRIPLFSFAGIKVTLDYSWLIIFALVAWSLSAGYFPHYFPDYGFRLYWTAGIVASILFFASILIHELAHSLTAVRAGIAIPEITLFIFGGVAHLSEEPSDPKTELKIAAAGPLASFLLAILFWLIKNALQGTAPDLLVAVFEYLAWINLALGIFNLGPGYPLDGGRILRAIVWWTTGSMAWATKWASDIGKGFAWALMILGVVRIFSGALIGGLWLIFIGMFLKGLAASGYRDLVMKQSFEGVNVEDLMVEDVISVPPDLTLAEATDSFFLRYGHGGFPVMQESKVLGLINLAKIKDIGTEERSTTTVAQVMIPLSSEVQIDPSESLIEALKKMTRSDLGRLLVMREGRMIGMITKTGLLRFLEIKQVLQA